jgi:hypothetical protein
LTHFLSLENVFGDAPVFLDKDGDGYPDALNLSIVIPPSLRDPHVWAGLLNVTARLAFRVLGLDSPILRKGRSPQPGTHHLVLDLPGKGKTPLQSPVPPARLSRTGLRTAHLGGSSPQSMMTLLNALALQDPQGMAKPLAPTWKRLEIAETPPKRLAVLDARNRCLAVHALPREPRSAPGPRKRRSRKQAPPFDLLNLVGDKGLFETDPGNPRALRPRVSIRLAEKGLSPETGLALSEILASMALHATEIVLPWVYVGAPPGRHIILEIREENTEEPEVTFLRRARDRAGVLRLRGSPRPLAKAMKHWFDRAMTDGGPGSETMAAFRDRVEAFRDLAAGRGYWGQWARFLVMQTGKRLASVPPAPASTKPKIAAACRALSLPEPPLSPRPQTLYRTARWKGEVREVLQLVRSVPRGQGPLWGEILVSKPLPRRKALQSRLEKTLREQGYEPHVHVLNAYKPGLSWLLEDVLPRLETCGALSRVEISYRPFRPSKKALEMRSRWLQEIYPGPALLTRRLKLDVERVRITERPGLQAVYRVQAWGPNPRSVLDRSFSPPWTRRPFLGSSAARGLVHPTTACVRLWQPERVILDKTVPTDREAFWQIFQNRWLPMLEEAMEKRLVRESSQDQPAFWQEIGIQVEMEETDTRLHFMEERISPMEALHEDLYFVLLEAYAAFSRRRKLPSSLQLGRILPVLKIRSGKGFPKASLKARPLVWTQAPPGRKGLSLAKPPLTALRFDNRFWRLAFDLKPWRRPSHRDAFLTLARSWGFEVEKAGGRGVVLSLKAPPEKAAKGKRKPKPHSGATAPRKNRLFKAREVEAWLKRLNRFPALHVWEVCRSSQGRPLYAMETASPHRLSIPKLRLLKPTLFFNARHHANEVSSTNAALSMAWFMAATRGGRAWLKEVNAVWIPLENPDGVATFEHLLPTGRHQKLHAARYNALGVEFYGDYFEPEPRFGEARAKPRVWRRWLPEIMVDHHGVPDHEWEQPFSGYAPFRFREFWIPRTFVYLYVPFVDKPDHPLHGTAHRLARTLRRAMAQEKDIVRMNRKRAALYRTYAFKPEPRVFPPSKGEALLILPPMPRNFKTNFAVRYPEVTRCELVVEVPDEGARASSLETCVRAHLTVQEALIRHVSHRPKGGISGDFDPKTGTLRLQWVPGGK